MEHSRAHRTRAQRRIDVGANPAEREAVSNCLPSVPEDLVAALGARAGVSESPISDLDRCCSPLDER